jgi:mycothiol synthase
VIPVSLPDGYTARAPAAGDAQAVAELIAACQLADGGAAEMTAEELLSDWQGLDLAEEAIVVLAPDQRPSGYADVLNRRYVRVTVYGYAHPEQRGRGVGTYLVRWGEAWVEERIRLAPAHARVVVEHFVHASNSAARILLASLGYVHVRTHYWMAITLDAAPPRPTWSEGLGVRTFVAGQDEQALYEAGEEAFQDTWDRPPSTPERWLAPTRARGFDPTLWFLAEDQRSGEVVGVCLCQVVAGRGHVDSIGVRRHGRRRGLGLALLQHAFGELFRRGIPEVSLTTDSESSTGAPRLYSRAGMHVTKSYVLYRKQLRPGTDFSAQE